MIMNKRTSRHYKAGYVVHEGEWVSSNGQYSPNMKWAENLFGDYIGTPVEAYRLCKVRGILPEPLREGGVCRIGFSSKEQKWYGWSHRAIAGFGIGDEVDSEDHLCAASGWTDEYLNEHPEANKSLPVGFKAQTLEDAKLMAIAFTEAVG